MEWSHVIAIVVPIIFAIIVGIFYNNRRIDDLRSEMNQRFADMNQRLIELNQRISELQTDMREMKNYFIESLKKEAGYSIKDK
ncbi:MAG TPA: hypothetical protein ENN22_08050 [bacterium]|nr:hypothetical protein [bacterium]